MERVTRFAPCLYAIFRIVAGLMFLMHGTQKLLGWPGDKPAVPLSSLMGVAGALELRCGLLVMVGLFTGIAAFVAAGEMAAAYFIVHARGGLWPILNQGELAALYCFAFLYIAAQGAGVWSIDSLRHKRLPAVEVREMPRRIA